MSTSRIGRSLAAGCLLATGLAALLAGALSTSSDEGDRAAVDAYAAHAGRVDGALAAEVFIVLLGAAIALAALLARPRTPKLATFAGWAGVISGSAWVALIGVDLVTRAASKADGEAGRAASARVLGELTSLPQFQVFVFVALLGGLAAMVSLGVALWRSRAVPRVAAVALAAYQPVNILTGDAGPGARAVAGALLLVGFAACAIEVLRRGVPAPAAAPADGDGTLPTRAGGAALTPTL